jgi:hypothetical protein
MTMQYYDAAGNPVDPDEVNQKVVTLPRKEIRELERIAKESKDLRAENEQLKKERAFVQAGIPLEDKRAAYFIAGYQGETNAEAIKLEWTESFGGGSSDQSGTIDAELAAQRAAQSLVTHGAGQPPSDQLALRNTELAALSHTDPTYPQKFDAIMAKYGGVFGDMHS